MDASRTKVLARIMVGLAQEDAAYPLPLALLDLNAYRDAGSIPGAIAGVVEQAAVEKATAEFTIDEIRSVGFADVPSTQKIIAWLYPNGSDFDASGNPVSPIPEKLKQLTLWMNENGLADIPWYQFLGDSPGLEKARQRFLAHLGIK